MDTTRHEPFFLEVAVRYTLFHHGVPLGFAELAPGELAAGPFVALPTLGSICNTVGELAAPLDWHRRVA